LAHQAEASLPKPSLETNHSKVVARLEREGWVPRHGGDYDVYKDPSKPGPHRCGTPPNLVDRRRTRDRESRRLDRLKGNRDEWRDTWH
jgi:hypothetical protein